ncbi:MAG: hypothetical protein M1831_000592, partial [Alyxoria varia]
RSIDRFFSLLHPASYWILLTVPLLNILVACRPLYGKQDDLSDIPLTPTQRQLLNLPPVSQPATPSSQYITPPKYSRSTSASRGSSLSRSGSSLSKSSMGASGSGTSFSPSASPLFHKAVGRDATRRLSYGSPSGLGMERSLNQSNLSLPPASHSPNLRKPCSIELSNRYIYNQNRSSSFMERF